MPPWSAAPGIRPLANDPTLTTRELALLLAWVDGGLPRGDAADLAPPRTLTEWPLGAPDDVIALPSQSVATDGVTIVRDVRIPTRAAGTRWLRRFDVVPGNRAALRAAFLYLEHGGARQWLGTWTPLHITSPPPGLAFGLPPDAALVAELHYNAWDEPTRTVVDASRLGLYLDTVAPQSPGRSWRTSAAATADRPGRSLQSDIVVPEDAHVWALRPRLMRGTTVVAGALEILASRPDGTVEPLVWQQENVPDWQVAYELRDPVELPRGSRVRLVAHATDVLDPETRADLEVAWFAAPRAATPARVTAAGTSAAALRP
jgi:hypothetical protein